MPNITLCADDFAFNEAVSEGILDLLDNKRLSAVSCMVNFPLWQHYANKLRQYDIDSGLHFNLTDGQGLTKNLKFMPLTKLIKAAYFKKIDPTLIEAEFNAQLDAFISASNKIPDFIDGHQHIQQLPIIRDAILTTYKKRFKDKKPYLRIPHNGFRKTIFSLLAFPKPQLIMLLGGLTLKRQYLKNAIPHNQTFAGIYNLNPQANYADYFKKFLALVGDNGLIMCHPGKLSMDKTDPINQARQNEYDFFQQDEFLEVCRLQNINVTPLHIHSYFK